MSYRQQGYRPQTGGTRTRRSGTRPAPPRRSTPPRGRKRRGHPLRTFLLLILFALAATAAVLGLTIYQEIRSVEEENTFYKGVYINNIPLNGATPQEAYTYILGRAQEEMSAFAITLRFGDNQWRITPETLGMHTALETVVQDAVNEAFFVGRTGSLLERGQTVFTLRSEPYYAFTSSVEKNTSFIDSLLAQMAAAVNLPARDASFAFDGTRNNPIIITEEQPGRWLDTDQLKAQLTDMIHGMQPGEIDLQPTEIPPQITAAMIRESTALIAEATTEIASFSTENRNKNVQRGLDSFNNMIIPAGKTISFNGTVGKRTEANGFFSALEIVGGEYEEGIGGGICQVSSTLYNAVIQAGMKVNSRTNHAIPVSYMPMGEDATVSDRGIDFKFTNNTGSNVYVSARMGGNSKNKTCSIRFYGVKNPDGYTYAFRHEKLEEYEPTEQTIKDRTGQHVRYTDQKHTVKGEKGYKVRTYLVTYQNGSVVREDFLYDDVYKAVSTKIYVGVEERQ
ncbi:MAG: VanW family protein [Oscillospiraceae bacterium]|jgi:vancomycin resistance protein YoaR|nr:VanW family protein [Oscillospiraceae bacterium]